MTLSKKHLMPKKSDREPKKYFNPIYKMTCPTKKAFEKTESILDAVTCDIVNGYSKSDIFYKLANGEYPYMTKGLKDSACYDYYNAALQRLAFDADENEKQMRDKLYNMYLSLYQNAVEEGNNMQAKAILDSIVKMGGLDKPKQPTVNIQTEKGNLNINFGFSDEQEAEETE